MLWKSFPAYHNRTSARHRSLFPSRLPAPRRPVTGAGSSDTLPGKYRSAGKKRAENETLTGHNALAIAGDINIDCSIDVADAVLLARFCTEDSTAVITDQGKQNADVNKDGNIELADVTAILRKIARLD